MIETESKLKLIFNSKHFLKLLSVKIFKTSKFQNHLKQILTLVNGYLVELLHES